MDFQPNTTIYFCRTGINSNNKVVCKTKAELFETILRDGNLVGRMTNTSFQRTDYRFGVRVDHDAISYYQLLQCDTVFYENEEQFQAFWIVGNITSVEWRNENCSFVHFVVDPFMTYGPMIDWDNTYAYIERRHVKNDWSTAMHPLFSNIGPAEDFRALADTPLFYASKSYKLNYVLIYSPYNGEGEATFEGEIKTGMYSSMNTIIATPVAANNFFKDIAKNDDCTINNIVGVYAMPDDFVGAIAGELPDFEHEFPCVDDAGRNHPTNIEYNNAKCWSAPYCIIRLSASNGQSIDFTPQWFGNDISDYTFLARGRFAGDQWGGIAATFKNRNGIFDWRAWNDFTVILDELPRCYWTADGFTDWYQINKAPMTMQLLAAFGKMMVNGAAAAITDNPIAIGKEVFDYANTVVNLSAQIQQVKATGATVSGGGGFSGIFDVGQDAWGFKINYYMAQNYIMKSIDGYFDRFGYRINRLEKLEPETRPIWSFLKTNDCHVISKTGIPIVYEAQINAILNSGVTIWNQAKYQSGQQIGDFSDTKGNRGIQGG